MSRRQVLALAILTAEQNFAVTGHRRAGAAVLREGGCPLSDAADVGRNLKGFVATFVTPQGGT